MDLSFAPPTLNIGAFGENSEFVCDTDTLKLINPVPGRDARLSYSNGKINLSFGDVGFYYLDATYYCKNDESISFKVRFEFVAEISLYVTGFDTDTSSPYTIYYTPGTEIKLSIPISVKRSDGKPITIDDADYKALKAYISNGIEPGIPTSNFGALGDGCFTLTPVNSADNTVAKYTLDIDVPANFRLEPHSRPNAPISRSASTLNPQDNSTTPHPHWINGWDGDFFRVSFKEQAGVPQSQ